MFIIKDKLAHTTTTSTDTQAIMQTYINELSIYQIDIVTFVMCAIPNDIFENQHVKIVCINN